MKQMIVMRTDLNMRKGKMIAQGAHASLGAVLPYRRWSWWGVFSVSWWRGRRKVKRWLAGPFAKVCVCGWVVMEQLLGIVQGRPGCGFDYLSDC